MNDVKFKKIRLIVNIIPLMLLLIGGVANAMVLEVGKYSEIVEVEQKEFDFALPDIETNIYDTKKQAYDNEFGIDSSKLSTQINLDGLFEEEDVEDDQALIDKILAGEEVDNNIYANKNNYQDPTNNSYYNKPTQPTYTEKKEVVKEEVKEEPKSLFNQSSGSTNTSANSSLMGKNLKCYTFGDQSIKAGQIVKMRLAEELKVGTHVLQKNSLIYGIAHFKENRLMVTVENVLIGNNQSIPVNLVLYDEYMIKGIEFEGIEEISDATNEAGADISEDITQKLPGGQYMEGVSGIFKKKQKNPEVFLLDGIVVFLRSGI